MTESGPTSVYTPEVKYENYNYLNWTDFENTQFPNFTETIIFHVILFILCFLGLWGNGKVIWLLVFHMKRNSFSVYVLNLAVADSGVLIMQILTQISQIHNPKNFRARLIFNLLYFVLYNTSQLLLISISVDRCVSVLFPIWHQCHRPSKLSLIVCVITWVLPIMFFALEMVIIFSESFLLFQLIFNGLISYPVMIISTLILLVQIFCKQRQLKRKKVLKLTLLALMCFIVFRLPMSILSIVSYSIVRNSGLPGLFDDLLGDTPIEDLFLVDIFLDFAYSINPWFRLIIILTLLSDISIAVNSSINPILYFLAGRNKEDRSRVSLKRALHRIFRNEEDSKDNEMQSDDTRL